eukprot:COSAG01_NODE_15089_length_1376_cov_1.205168_1_plen_20_part_10
MYKLTPLSTQKRLVVGDLSH